MSATEPNALARESAPTVRNLDPTELFEWQQMVCNYVLGKGEYMRTAIDQADAYIRARRERIQPKP